MAIEDGLCEAVLVVSETGKTLRDIGLRIAPLEPFLSTPRIFAKPVLSTAKEFLLQRLSADLQAVIPDRSQSAKGSTDFGDTRGYHQ